MNKQPVGELYLQSGQFTSRKVAKKNKKILKLNRQIAALNDHGGFAFNAPKCNQSEYDRHQSPCSLQRAKMLLYYFDCSISNLKEFTILIHTSTGYYRLEHVESVICDLTPNSEHIEIEIISPEAIQKTEIFDFKILDNLGRCIHVSAHFSQLIGVGDTFRVPYRINAG